MLELKEIDQVLLLIRFHYVFHGGELFLHVYCHKLFGAFRDNLSMNFCERRMSKWEERRNTFRIPQTWCICCRLHSLDEYEDLNYFNVIEFFTFQFCCQRINACLIADL